MIPSVETELLAFVAVLAAAGGADLALAVLLLGLMPHLGWAEPPGTLPWLQAPAVIVSVIPLYAVEWMMERHPGGFALWHTFQRWVRLVGILLLTGMAAVAIPLEERILLVAGATLLGLGVYMGASGWEGVMVLRRLPGRSRGLSALAIDVAFGGLLVLALEEPFQAFAALVLLLVVAAVQLPAAVRAHLALVRSGRAWLHGLMSPGRWTLQDELPGRVCRAVEAEPGRPLRGARATLLGPARVRIGWIVVAAGGPVFLEGKGPPLHLTAPAGSRSLRGPLHTRRAVLADGEPGELLVLRDGPGAGELDEVIPPNVSHGHG